MPLSRAIPIAWLLAAAMLCLVLRPLIADMIFSDPDDAMRLLQVRDWMDGQSWWDVGQHRLNGGDFPMHWSRLVDLPLAAVMLVFDPLVGRTAATRIAMVVVPLTTLLAIMATAAHLTRRLAGEEQARLAMLLAALAVPLIYQVRPMRIDHHGWQIALALAATVALVTRPTAGGGAMAGLALAALVTISLEGLPIAALIAGVAALAWASEPHRRGFVKALVVSLFAGAAALHLATRGPFWLTSACDAISPAWLVMLGIAAAAVLLTTHLRLASPFARIAALATGGAAAVASLLVIAPECARGPFATLDPLVRTIWYDSVQEGLPLWHQSLGWAVMTVALPIVGLFGTVRALRRSTGEARTRWLLMLAVLLPATLLSCLVNRAGATANALALPGAASLLMLMLLRARAVPGFLPRVGATAAALVVASPGLAAGGALAIARLVSPPVQSLPMANGSIRQPCETFADVRALGRLSAGVVFLPIDVTPELIATTRHTAIAGGYHRNAAAMHKVLASFTGTPEQAEAIVRRAGATYVAGCPGFSETNLYRYYAPRGFWARLERGERFDWLRPIAMSGSPVLVWRVVRTAAPLPRAMPRS
jgi:hypothetical protein